MTHSSHTSVLPMLSIQPGRLLSASRAQPAQKTKSVPRHLALVLDGRDHDDPTGPVRALHETICGCIEEGIECLSLLIPARHQSRNAVLPMLCAHIARDAQTLATHGVRISLLNSGKDSGSALNGHKIYVDELRAALVVASSAKVAQPERLRINLGVAYSGRTDLAHAVRRIAYAISKGELKPGELCIERLSQELHSSGLPVVDFLVRTGGETRLSDFLLFHTAYAELLFLDVPWAEFRQAHLKDALADFGRRSRTFGGLPKR